MPGVPLYLREAFTLQVLPDRKSEVRQEKLPQPTLRYRLRAWRALQRMLDPLARPRPLRRPPPR